MQMEGRRFSHREKCLCDRHGVSKNSPAGSLMALGIMAEVRGGGVLEFAPVAEWKGGATDGGGRGARPRELDMRWDRLGASTGWGRERPAGGGVGTRFFPVLLNTEKGARIEVVRGPWAEGAL